MDSLIIAAARSLAVGDPLGALKHVALRDDPPALALRGTAMAQLGELVKAKELLRRAANAFGAREPVARARCHVAGAEIALVLRDLGEPTHILAEARKTLDHRGDSVNSAHAGYLQARRLLLIGRLDEAQAILETLDPGIMSPASRAGAWLVAAGIAMRRIESGPAGAALEKAAMAAELACIASLIAEVRRAEEAFRAPAARLLEGGSERPLMLGEVETLIASNNLIIDATRNIVRKKASIVTLVSRPLLFALIRLLAEAWPGDVARQTLLARAFRARQADESHRARLRVEIGRLRAELLDLAEIQATERGFMLKPTGAGNVVVLAPPQEGDHAAILALLADGEAWSSSALALTLDVSVRTVQRALETLASAGKIDSFGRGRACRWMARQVPGFPTSLLLPAPLPVG
jgi:hypothetical protein